MITEKNVSKIGRFGKPHGTKGELPLITEFDIFDNIEEPYIVCPIDGIFVPFYIDSYRWKNDKVILLSLENINTESDAKRFTNLDVYVPTEMLSDVFAEEDFSWKDLIGFTVEDTQLGELGKIMAVDDSTMNILLNIDHQGKELLLPVAEEFIIDLNVEDMQLTVKIPEGLMEL